jgi:hypothetical protein
MVVLGEGQRRRFETEMAVHLATFFPEPCAAMGDDEIALFIRRTVDKALAYGIERERDVCKFLDIAMALGRDFDRDPEFPWSREILTDSTLGGIAKIDRLVELAIATIDRGKAPNG